MGVSVPSPNYKPALAELNRQLILANQKPLSPTQFYRLRRIYVELFPRSKWLMGRELYYSESVLLFLYFLAQIHIFCGRLAMTKRIAKT